MRSSTKPVSWCRFAFAVTWLGLGASGLWAGDTPWYVQGKLGEASVETTLGSRHTKTSNGDDTARSVEIGYRLNRHLAIEAGVHDFGEFEGFGSPCPDSADACIERLALEPTGLCVEGTPCTELLAPVGVELTGVSLSLVPRWPVTDRFSVYGRLGWIDWEAEISGLFFPPPGERESFSDGELLAGAGARYDFPAGLGLLVEYERFDLDFDRLSLGLGWAF